MPKKIGLISLGCPKNLVDSEAMLGLLAQAGYHLTRVPSEADFLVVNTCGFIAAAKQESIRAILDLARFRRQGSCRGLIVAGCLAQRFQEELARQIPEIDAFLGTSDFLKVVEVVARLEKGGGTEGPLKEVHDPQGLADEKTPRLLATPGYSAFLKIAEGCNHGCAFCVVPALRGRFRSRRLESCVAEARMLAKAGVRELNLISQSTSEYGRDLYGRPRLRELLEKLAPIPGLRWIRPHYLYPAFLDDKLLDFWAGERKITPYVDLPLQHADSGVLRAMGRPGSFDFNLKLVERLRRRLPKAVIRSSFILGFPGETDAAFARLLKFLAQARLERVGFFTFSREEGTPAYHLPGQVSLAIARTRLKQAAGLAREISRKHLKGLVGSDLEVLVESSGAGGPKGLEHGQDAQPRRQKGPRGGLAGRSVFDAPEIDGKVYFTGRRTLKPGEFVRLRITGADAYDLKGRQVS